MMFAHPIVSYAMSKEGDIILVYHQDQPAFYARIEGIEPDVKQDWYQLTLLLLSIPARTVTWILRGEYMNGAPFTMDGESMRLEEVRRKKPVEKPDAGSPLSRKKGESVGPKVILFPKKDTG
jgi:hypothetical protein